MPYVTQTIEPSCARGTVAAFGGNTRVSSPWNCLVSWHRWTTTTTTAFPIQGKAKANRPPSALGRLDFAKAPNLVAQAGSPDGPS